VTVHALCEIRRIELQGPLARLRVNTRASGVGGVYALVQSHDAEQRIAHYVRQPASQPREPDWPQLGNRKYRTAKALNTAGGG